jgi:hypothetical protein
LLLPNFNQSWNVFLVNLSIIRFHKNLFRISQIVRCGQAGIVKLSDAYFQLLVANEIEKEAIILPCCIYRIFQEKTAKLSEAVNQVILSERYYIKSFSGQL